MIAKVDTSEDKLDMVVEGDTSGIELVTTVEVDTTGDKLVRIAEVDTTGVDVMVFKVVVGLVMTLLLHMKLPPNIELLLSKMVPFPSRLKGPSKWHEKEPLTANILLSFPLPIMVYIGLHELFGEAITIKLPIPVTRANSLSPTQNSGSNGVRSIQLKNPSLLTILDVPIPSRKKIPAPLQLNGSA